MLRSIVVPALGIVAASTGLGLCFNALRDHDQIEISRAYFAPSTAPSSGTARDPGAGSASAGSEDNDNTGAPSDLAARAAREFTLVDTDRAVALFAVAEEMPGDVVFLDAREDVLFKNGHIPDAQRIDYFNMRRYIEPSLPFLRIVPWLVVYCESADCEDGFLLCKVLRDEYRIPSDRLLLYVGGMQEWREFGHPIAKGFGLR